MDGRERDVIVLLGPLLVGTERLQLKIADVLSGKTNRATQRGLDPLQPKRHALGVAAVSHAVGVEQQG